MSSRKSILKLSAREERELRQVNAARRRTRLLAENRQSGRFADILNRWAENLVYFDPDTAPNSRLSIRHRKKIAVFVRDDFTCRDCGTIFGHPEPYKGEHIPGLTMGHIIPASQGGPWTRENLIAQCDPCNQALADQVWEQR